MQKTNMQNTKEYKATQKYLIMSPRKLRLVVGLIKKMKPADAVERLPFAERRAAGDLAKVIKSALANAKNQGVSETDLVFKEIQLGEGPRLKRGKAASRGRWHPFKRRMSHIRVILTTKESKVPSTKSETISKTENSKPETKNETKKKSADKTVKAVKKGESK
jgi:large subunit ribosomal protein L22